MSAAYTRARTRPRTRTRAKDPEPRARSQEAGASPQGMLVVAGGRPRAPAITVQSHNAPSKLY